jgi:transposase
MDYHQNARLTVHSREQMCQKVVLEGLTLKLAAASFNVSAKTAAKWVGRYREAGGAGLGDRSSRPLRLREPTEFGNLAWPTSAVCFGPPFGTLMLRELGSAGA